MIQWAASTEVVAYVTGWSIFTNIALGGGEPVPQQRQCWSITTMLLRFGCNKFFRCIGLLITSIWFSIVHPIFTNTPTEIFFSYWCWVIVFWNISFYIIGIIIETSKRPQNKSTTTNNYKYRGNISIFMLFFFQYISPMTLRGVVVWFVSYAS